MINSTFLTTFNHKNLHYRIESSYSFVSVYYSIRRTPYLIDHYYEGEQLDYEI